MKSPTAQMSVAETMATPLRTLVMVLGFGLETTLQLLPFHRAMSVCWRRLALMKSPTAQPLSVETAVTPFRTPACFGALTVRQLVPFQCSMSGGTPLMVNPTAQTSFVETAATPRSLPFATLGLGTTLHAVPFQCSVIGPTPTAQTSLAETLATAWSSLALGLGRR